MHLFFIDDARQRNPNRPGMGALVAIGGIIVPAQEARALEREVDRICRDEFQFPPAEPFKWSPNRNYWMRDNLVTDRRQAFFERVLLAAAQHGAKAHVSVEDERRGMATGRARSHGIDVIMLALERLDWALGQRQSHGVVIAARPGGGQADDDRFLEQCVELVTAGTDYSRFDRIITNIVTTPFNNTRLLQLADLVVSSTTALVAGHREFAEPVFAHVRPLLLSSGGRIGGVGLKLHPDYSFVNLYHWLLGDEIYWRMNMGVELPMPGRPYAEGPMQL